MPTIGSVTALASTNFAAAVDNTLDQTAKGDLGAGSADALFVKVTFTTGTVSADGYVDVYLSESDDDFTQATGLASGSDAAYSQTAEVKSHMRFLGRIPVDATDDTTLIIAQFTVPGPINRYIAVVTENQTNSTLTTGTVEHQTVDY